MYICIYMYVYMFIYINIEIKTSFWNIWIAQWLKFFCTTTYFFSILAILRRKRWLKVGPKVVTLGPSLFYKYQDPSRIFQTVFFFARVLTLVRISAILDNIEGARAPKPRKNGYFVDADSVRKTLEIFNSTTTNAILIKLTTIMYLHESVNRKAVRIRNSFSFFYLI